MASAQTAERGDPLASRLNQGLKLMESGIEFKDEMAQLQGFDFALRPFFDSSVMIDRPPRLNKLTSSLERFLKERGSEFSLPVLKDMQSKLNEALVNLEKTAPEYEKTGWIHSAAAGITFSSLVHATDRWILPGKRFLFLPLPGRKVLRKSVEAAGRWIESKSTLCKGPLTKLALSGVGKGIQKSPRLAMHFLLAPTFGVPMHYFYFSHHENWDPTEEALRDRIEPLLETLIERAERLEPRR